MTRLHRVVSLLLILLPTIVEGQWSVLPQAPVPSSRINDVFFLNANGGWIASGAGLISATSDGGTSWTPQFQRAGTHFRSIGFANGFEGWAGALGWGDVNNPSSTDTTILYKTSDGGVTWVPEPKVSGAIARGFCGMNVVNDTVVYGVGRVRGPAYFYRTTNGGATWDVRNMSGFAAGLIDVYFFSVDTGIAVGLTNSDHAQSSGVVLKTTDRGTTWSVVHTTTRTGEWCWKISFPSRNMGYVSLQRNSLAPIYLLKTTDGGDQWNDVHFSSTHYFVQGIGFIDDSTGWIGGNSSFPPYVTTDGGSTWSPTTIGRRVNRFRFVPGGVGYAAGETVYRYERTPTSVAERPHTDNRNGPSGAYPNPFNPATTIRFTVPPEMTTSPVRLIVYDALGREVARLVDDELEGGTYERTWLARHMSSGTYTYRLSIGSRVESRQIVLVK